MSETPREGERCAYELCKRSDPITVIAGHRPRRYHDENCRQAQHRLQKRRAQVNEDDQARCQPPADVVEEECVIWPIGVILTKRYDVPYNYL